MVNSNNMRRTIINVSSVIDYGDGSPDMTDSEYVGYIKRSKDADILTYTDNASRVELIIKRDLAELIRSGEVTSRITIGKDSYCEVEYEIPEGTLVFECRGQQYRMRRNEETGSMRAAYTLANDDQIISRNLLAVKYTVL